MRGFLLELHAAVAGRTAGGRSSLASEFFRPVLKLSLASEQSSARDTDLRLYAERLAVREFSQSRPSYVIENLRVVFRLARSESTMPSSFAAMALVGVCFGALLQVEAASSITAAPQSLSSGKAEQTDMSVPPLTEAIYSYGSQPYKVNPYA